MVTEEVRKLAEESRKAAEKIQNIIKKVQSKSKNAFLSISKNKCIARSYSVDI